MGQIFEHTKCDVCEILDGDSSVKETAYCGICDAHICNKCRPDFGRRALAMALRRMRTASKRVTYGVQRNLS
jgi:hypothetical protein